VPPKDIQDAMNRQMSAERIRRAMVIESEGSGFLHSRCRGRETVGHPQRPRETGRLPSCEPKDSPWRLEKIFGTAKTVDSKTMMLQYFETLKQMERGRPPSSSPHGVHGHVEAAGQPRGGRREEGGRLNHGRAFKNANRAVCSGGGQGRGGLPGLRGTAKE